MNVSRRDLLKLLAVAAGAGLAPRSLEGADGPARLLAFERNIDYHMSEELKQAGGNEALEKPIDLAAKLGAPAHVYDLRTGKYLGLTDTIPFTLDPWRPSLFALSDKPLPPGNVVEWLNQPVHSNGK